MDTKERRQKMLHSTIKDFQFFCRIEELGGDKYDFDMRMQALVLIRYLETGLKPKFSDFTHQDFKWDEEIFKVILREEDLDPEGEWVEGYIEDLCFQTDEAIENEFDVDTYLIDRKNLYAELKQDLLDEYGVEYTD